MSFSLPYSAPDAKANGSSWRGNQRCCSAATTEVPISEQQNLRQQQQQQGIIRVLRLRLLRTPAKARTRPRQQITHRRHDRLRRRLLTELRKRRRRLRACRSCCWYVYPVNNVVFHALTFLM